MSQDQDFSAGPAIDALANLERHAAVCQPERVTESYSHAAFSFLQEQLLTAVVCGGDSLQPLAIRDALRFVSGNVVRQHCDVVFQQLLDLGISNLIHARAVSVIRGDNGALSVDELKGLLRNCLLRHDDFGFYQFEDVLRVLHDQVPGFELRAGEVSNWIHADVAQWGYQDVTMYWFITALVVDRLVGDTRQACLSVIANQLQESSQINSSSKEKLLLLLSELDGE